LKTSDPTWAETGKTLCRQSRVQKDVARDIRENVLSLESGMKALREGMEEYRAGLETPPEGNKTNFERLNEIVAGVLSRAERIEYLVEELEQAHPALETVHFEKQNLKILVKNLVTDYQNTRSKGERIYELHYEADGMVAVLDARKFLRILDNLLDNATRFTPRGHILVHVADTPQEWILSVKDSGSGIPENRIEGIFERNEVCPDAAGKRGRGCGLSEVRKLVECHRGRIGVTSIPGKRTTFEVRIPRDLPPGRYSAPVSGEPSAGGESVFRRRTS
jgi:signal transduction histidine kinase